MPYSILLLEQAFVKDPDQTVGDLVAAKVGKLGENIQVGRFARFKLGEGPATAATNNGSGDSKPCSKLFLARTARSPEEKGRGGPWPWRRTRRPQD